MPAFALTNLFNSENSLRSRSQGLPEVWLLQKLPAGILQMLATLL